MRSLGICALSANRCRALTCVRMCEGKTELMVGPDSVASSAGDDVVQRQRDDDYDDDETTTVSEVDIVQLLTRRLSVTPPSDVPYCPATLERPHTTASTSAEVDTHFSLSPSVCLCVFLSPVLSHTVTQPSVSCSPSFVAGA